MTEPCDAKTAEEFSATCASEAADLALLFAGEPEDKMAVALQEMRERMEPQLTDTVGAEAAASICDVFVAVRSGAAGQRSRRLHLSKAGDGRARPRNQSPIS